MDLVSALTANDDSLPRLIERAGTRLVSAKSSAEVLEAIDYAKSVLALARIRKASAESQADCLTVINAGQLRLESEVTAGQERGEIAVRGDPRGSGVSFQELGMDDRRVAEWREVAEAGGMDLVHDVIAKALEDDRAPTQAEINREAKRRLRKDEIETLRQTGAMLPAGRYETIVIDPPWEMKKIAREVRPNQVEFDYPTMDEEELAAFPVADMAADDCHLFCWTTQKHLPSALRLLEAWDFRYCLVLVWHKAGGFQPIGLPQYNCEFIVYGRRGAPKFVDTKDFPCCSGGDRREHSRKPDVFYDRIRRVTAGPRIDVFSREAREGFEQYGNEVGKFAA